MKLPALLGITLSLLATPVATALAQQTYPQMPVNMAEMQKVQTEYQDLKKQKELKRKAITDKIAAEELVRAKQQQASSGSLHDPYAVAEMRTKERIQVLKVNWKKQDQELEVRMHEKMMQNSGMGNMYKTQQEMMNGHGYAASPAQTTPQSK